MDKDRVERILELLELYKNANHGRETIKEGLFFALVVEDDAQWISSVMENINV